MKNFIHSDFLLSSATARRLYHDFAESEPICDYHTHLSPRVLAENRPFANLTEIWLEGDHYKWRAMRANGVLEKFCTGPADPFEKFQAWAETVPRTLGNPLYHWTHLELKRYFGIDELLDGSSACRIWDRANEQLQGEELTPRGILKKFKVTYVGTTDDPTDDLSWHRTLASLPEAARVLPAFRPDAALNVHLPEKFNSWVDRLAEIKPSGISTLEDFLVALKQRHDYFHEQGCRLSDHGLEQCYADFPSETEAAMIFVRAREGQAATPEEQARFAALMMLKFGHWDAERGWTKQLHLGALRNNNHRLLKNLGPDTGFDSIGDFPQARSLSAYLDRLDQDNRLPKTILYNLNPADNYVFAAMTGNFQDGSVAGKIQWGSGWWFLDQKEAMEWQLKALGNLGLLSRFVGMVTDSRSFMSYPRHEYFRRTLCNWLGRAVEDGEMPDDEALLGRMVEDICYRNARNYLNFPE